MIGVAIDGRRLQDRPLTGVGRSLAGMLPHIAAGAEVTVLTDRRRPDPETAGCPVARLAGLGPLPETAWLQASAAVWMRQRRGLVFHGTFNALPLASTARSVVSIYDLSWEHHPEDLGRAKRLAFATQARWAARHADVIITASEFTARSISETYRIHPDRVSVIPIAVPAVFSPARRAEAGPLLDRLGVRRPYVVAVGGARRRGLPVAVQAWREATGHLGSDRPQLVVVGREPPPGPDGPDVVHAGPLGDQDWARVLAGAEVFVYPTRFEGFGMPALEAAAAGTPVVCASVASLPEVLGDAAEWVEAPTTAALAPALGALLGDAERRHQLRQEGLRRAAAFPGWEEIAARTVRVYERAAA